MAQMAPPVNWDSTLVQVHVLGQLSLCEEAHDELATSVDLKASDSNECPFQLVEFAWACRVSLRLLDSLCTFGRPSSPQASIYTPAALDSWPLPTMLWNS